MSKTELTWPCDVCHKQLLDAEIAVVKHDITSAGLPANTVVRNVKYCIDSEECYRTAHDPENYPRLGSTL